MPEHDNRYPVLLPGTEGMPLRYYSLARHALVQALRLCGVKSGGRVLVPAFICRDVLAAVHACGAEAVWYDISDDLTPALASTHWPEAEAVLMVNYFGFPQNLAPFQEYSQRTQARIIEDNAHGYGSRDETGQWLGLRAPLGIFSMRKTLRIPDGAALAVCDASLAGGLAPSLPFSGAGIHPAQWLKHRLRSLPVIGEVSYRLALAAVRGWRQWRGEGVSEDPLAERRIPAPPEPWSGLPHALSAYRFPHEAERRRNAYADCAQEAAKAGAMPVFRRLPDGCAPYGFAFRGAAPAVDSMKTYAKRRGWDCVVWPDLPDVIRPNAPDHYRNIHLINFLW